MARAVYSSQLISYSATTPNQQFDVPDGFTCIVRDIDAYQNVGAWILTLSYGNSLVAPAITVVALQADGVVNYNQWRGRIVVPAGGFVRIDANVFDTSLGVYVGGYLLADAAS